MIVDKLLLSLVQDKQLNGTGWYGAVRYFVSCQFDYMRSILTPGITATIETFDSTQWSSPASIQA